MWEGCEDTLQSGETCWWCLSNEIVFFKSQNTTELQICLWVKCSFVAGLGTGKEWCCSPPTAKAEVKLDWSVSPILKEVPNPSWQQHTDTVKHSGCMIWRDVMWCNPYICLCNYSLFSGLLAIAAELLQSNVLLSTSSQKLFLGLFTEGWNVVLLKTRWLLPWKPFGRARNTHTVF